MRFILLFWVVVWASFPAFAQTITSNVYAYDQLPVVRHTGYAERTLLEGSTRDYSHLIIQVITLLVNQPEQPIQQLDEEVVLIIKAGQLTLTLGSKRKILGPGSVAMIMPGDEYRIDNKAGQSLTYYMMRYTSNEMPDLDLYRLMGNSFGVDFQEIATTADSGRMLTYTTIMSNRIAMQVMTSKPGSGRQPVHTHRAAELILVLDKPVQVTINGTLKMAQAGDLIFVESDVSHGIQHSGQEGGSYLSFHF